MLGARLVVQRAYRVTSLPLACGALWMPAECAQSTPLVDSFGHLVNTAQPCRGSANSKWAFGSIGYSDCSTTEFELPIVAHADGVQIFGYFGACFVEQQSTSIGQRASAADGMRMAVQPAPKSAKWRCMVSFFVNGERPAPAAGGLMARR